MNQDRKYAFIIVNIILAILSYFFIFVHMVDLPSSNFVKVDYMVFSKVLYFYIAYLAIIVIGNIVLCIMKKMSVFTLIISMVILFGVNFAMWKFLLK